MFFTSSVVGDYHGVVSFYSEHKDLVYKDAVFFSMHKFVGGVDSPGMA